MRLSSEEYRAYRAACRVSGVRSLSELARTAMHQLVTVRSDARPVEDQLRDLRQRVQVMSDELEKIGRRVGDVNSLRQCSPG